MTMTTSKTYRIVSTEDGCYGVTVDGDLVNDGFTLDEAKEEAKRVRREDTIVDLREQVAAWVDSFDGDDSAEAIVKLRRALKILSA